MDTLYLLDQGQRRRRYNSFSSSFDNTRIINRSLIPAHQQYQLPSNNQIWFFPSTLTKNCLFHNIHMYSDSAMLMKITSKSQRSPSSKSTTSVHSKKSQYRVRVRLKWEEQVRELKEIGNGRRTLKEFRIVQLPFL